MNCLPPNLAILVVVNTIKEILFIICRIRRKFDIISIFRQNVFA